MQEFVEWDCNNCCMLFRVQRIESEMHSLYSVKSTPQAQTRFIIETERRLQAISLDSSSKLHNVSSTVPSSSNLSRQQQ